MISYFGIFTQSAIRICLLKTNFVGAIREVWENALRTEQGVYSNCVTSIADPFTIKTAMLKRSITDTLSKILKFSRFWNAECMIQFWTKNLIVVPVISIDGDHFDIKKSWKIF